MGTDASGDRSSARLQPDEKIPAVLALGLGVQLAGLALPGIVLMPTIVFRATGATEAVLLENQMQGVENFGGPGRTRTCDQRIMSPPL